MRIIDDRRDYYDHAHGYDSDATPLYLRRSSVLPLTSFPFFDWPTFGRVGLPARVRVVGVGGQVWLTHEFWHGQIDPRPDRLPEGPADVCCFSADEVDAHVGASVSDWSFHRRPPRNASQQVRKAIAWQLSLALPSVREQYALVNGPRPELFDLAGAPAFVIETPTNWRHRPAEISTACWMVTNPILSDLQLYRVLDPAATYQAIEGWLNNRAEPAPATLTLSNDDLAAAKGHGDPMAFRQASPGKKRKRRGEKRQ